MRTGAQLYRDRSVKALRLFVAATAVLAVPLVAYAQFSKPEDAIKYRKAAFTLMGAHFSSLGAVVKGARPFDAADVQKQAALVNSLAGLPWSAFGPGTEKGDTRALPQIWSNAEKFKAAQQAFEKAAAELNQAAQTGNEATFKTAFAATGKTCKGCHDDFRKD